MDQIAIISDIHGNMPAFDVVLNDIRQRGIEQIYCLGDLAGKGPDSDKVIDICQEVCAGTVQGNWDEFIAEPATEASRQWHKDKLNDQHYAYLASLPGTIDLTISGQHVRLFHASQKSVHHRVYDWDEYEKLKAMFDNTPFTGNMKTKPHMVIYGDIHQAYMLPVDGGRLVNAGSVGNPTDRITMAGYVILRGHVDSPARADISVDFIRLAYDTERAIQIARDVEMPGLAEYAFELRTGRYRRYMPEGYSL